MRSVDLVVHPTSTCDVNNVAPSPYLAVNGDYYTA